MNPEVSVVIPVKNGEATIGSALESILDQDFDPFEIVVVDHDSKDRTGEILSAFSDQSDCLRVFHETGTFVDAINRSWREARAPLIARMDADDLAYPSRLRKQKYFLDRHPHIAACGSLVHIRKRDQEGKLIPADGGYQRYEEWVNSQVSPEQIHTHRFVDSPLPNPSVMLRRSALEELNGYEDPTWAEDYDLWLRMLERGWKLGKIDEVLLDWIDGPERSTRNLDRYELSQFQKAKAHYLARISEVQQMGVAICGAGPIGKEFARLLQEKGIEIHCFLEVNPRQVGNQIHGIPVLESGEISGYPSKAVVLGASGRPGARDRIRDLAVTSGLTEGRDFFSIA